MPFYSKTAGEKQLVLVNCLIINVDNPHQLKFHFIAHHIEYNLNHSIPIDLYLSKAIHLAYSTLDMIHHDVTVLLHSRLMMERLADSHYRQ